LKELKYFSQIKKIATNLWIYLSSGACDYLEAELPPAERGRPQPHCYWFSVPAG
jgi:hypothetical protein